MNSKALFQELVSAISIPESRDEIHQIAYALVEKVLGLSRLDVMRAQSIEVLPEQRAQINHYVRRINTGEPLQYVIGEAYFYGRLFAVTNSVLIPRPETEELVEQVLKHCVQFVGDPLTLLDVGTGSGCIPITLSLELPNARITATDISEDALAVATSNADTLGAHVNFLKHDILRDPYRFPPVHVITSNPPYIPVREKDGMNKNVVDFEPSLALFVPDDDPLLYYVALAKCGKQCLVPSGLLIVEIYEQHGNEVAQVFTNEGFCDVSVIHDISGKPRMVKGYQSQ